jgi:hypothetical protein
MAAFATSDELAARLGLDSLTAGEKTRADALLKTVSGLAQEATGQTIEQVKDDELTRSGQADRRLFLPQRPVTGVASVTLNGVAIDAGSYHLEGSTLIRDDYVSPTGRPDYIGGGWGLPSETLVVKYTHGFESIPETVKAVCLEAVARVWVNPGNVSQEIHGGEQVQYGPDRGIRLTEAEVEDLDRAVRTPSGGSVGLR